MVRLWNPRRGSLPPTQACFKAAKAAMDLAVRHSPEQGGAAAWQDLSSLQKSSSQKKKFFCFINIQIQKPLTQKLTKMKKHISDHSEQPRQLTRNILTKSCHKIVNTQSQITDPFSLSELWLFHNQYFWKHKNKKHAVSFLLELSCHTRSEPEAHESMGVAGVALIRKKPYPENVLSNYAAGSTQGGAFPSWLKKLIAMNAWLPQASYPCGIVSAPSSVTAQYTKLFVLQIAPPLRKIIHLPYRQSRNPHTIQK